MKKKDIFLFILLLAICLAFICFSPEMRKGAYDGLVLAQNTIIPSLLPLLIIFLLITKTGARDVLAKAFGFISLYLFRLPMSAITIIILSQIGGYPMGALLTRELFESGDIDKEQARDLMCFCVCGGAGFIVTALGSAILNSTKAGMILLFSNIISNIIIGVTLSFFRQRTKMEFYSFSKASPLSDAVSEATHSAVKSVLDITAFIVLFGAINSILNPPDFLLPIFEITQGLCAKSGFSLPEISAYLSFGGFCIHLQLLPIIMKLEMKYTRFLCARIISSLLSYAVTKLLLIIFPIELSVFSNMSEQAPVFSSVNMGLSILLIVGCFVIVLDINSKRKIMSKA